jgi:aryl-alcohol dehydrogenase-like predicted oxidoreductase
MEYRRLGRSELKPSVVGVGTWQFAGVWGKDFQQDEVTQILSRANELGINFIDTAECYGDHLSESFIGEAIAHQRDQWILATKFGHNANSILLPEMHWEPEQIRLQLEASLKALKTDYIDLYQFHSGSDEIFNRDEIWTMLDEVKREGKIRHIGISIGKLDNDYQVGKALDVGASVIQVVYNILQRDAEAKVLPLAQANDLGIIVRTPLASGFLSGKYNEGTTWATGDVRSFRKQERVNKEIERANRLVERHARSDVNPAPWALEWCLRHPAVSCVIPGCKSVEQLEDNADASRWMLERPKATGMK